MAKISKKARRQQAEALREYVKGLSARYLFHHDLVAGGELVELGDTLAFSITRCSLNELLEKWPAHHYRPTLRGDVEPMADVLADIYDLAASVRGLNVKAYRG